MTETPQSRGESTATQPQATASPPERSSRINQIAVWVAIVAGVVFVVGVIFFVGFFTGRYSGDHFGDGDWRHGGVVIHISHGPEDPHRVLMALNMANMMSETRDVLVYFDINGINVVLEDSPDLTYAQFPSSKTQIASLLEKGIPLMACPGCLAAAGKTKVDLAPGIQVADQERFFSFTTGRILTLDY